MEGTWLQAALEFGKEPGPFTVLTLRGREEVSRPFRYQLDFTAGELNLEAATGSRVHLLLEHPHGEQRELHAVCSELSMVSRPQDEPGEEIRYRAVLVPEIYLVLSLRRGFRIFQKKTAVQIVQEVCEEAGLEAKFLDVSALSGKYPTREYCVQYDETDWDFLCRLLEEEGIFFSHRHFADHHVMRLEDNSRQAEKLPEGPLDYNAEPGSAAGNFVVWDWRAQARLCPAESALSDYDPLRPGLDLRAKASASGPVKRSWYEYPGRYVEPKEGTRLVQARLDSLRLPGQTVQASTNALFAQAGHRFDFRGHPSADGEYFITCVEVLLRFEDQTYPGPLVDLGSRGLDILLEAIPAARQFRPARITPRPHLPGLQTARVTGPAGAEIHCDSHGRVKVQFPWDRDGKFDDHSSCGLRVAQAHTTGSIMIPRVEWEVLVEFIDGDPDRPVCLGKLWNPLFQPPASLPESKAQLRHSSDSSPGGNGKNEVILDDSAGKERINIHAQRDISVKAANDKVFSVGNNASQTVHGKRTAQVSGNQKIAVLSNEGCKVGGALSVQVGAKRGVKVTGTATEQIGGDFTLKVGGAEMIQVGNPAKAALEAIKQMAIAAAAGAAGAVADRAAGQLLGPIMPAINQAKAVLGHASRLSGQAALLLGSGPPHIPGLNEAEVALSAVPESAEVGQLAAGMVQAALGGGAGGGGGGGGPEAADSATKGGSGTWGTVVGGNVTEQVGGLAATNSLEGISLSVGKATKETIGGVRIELIRGGKSESTGASKIETVGAYTVDAQESISIEAGTAAAENIAGTQRQKIGGSHSLTAKGPVKVIGPKLKLKGAGTITLTCGDTKVVIKSSGIHVEGGASLVIDGKKIELDEGALGLGP